MDERSEINLLNSLMNTVFKKRKLNKNKLQGKLPIR